MDNGFVNNIVYISLYTYSGVDVVVELVNNSGKLDGYMLSRIMDISFELMKSLNL